MSTTRYFPVTVCIRGDTSLTDREAIAEINRRLRWLADLQDIIPRLNSLDSIWDRASSAGLTLDLPLINNYQLQELDPAQFVVDRGEIPGTPGATAQDVFNRSRGMPKITIERAGALARCPDCNRPFDPVARRHVLDSEVNRFLIPSCCTADYRAANPAWKPTRPVHAVKSYDPTLGRDHPANHDPTLESEHDQYDRATGDFGAPVAETTAKPLPIAKARRKKR